MAADLALPDTDPQWIDLSSELTRLRELTDTAMNGAAGGEPHMIDSVAKLVTAVTKLAEFVLKSQNTVTLAELNSLTMGMGAAVDAHVTDPRVCSKIKRDWLRLANEATK